MNIWNMAVYLAWSIIASSILFIAIVILSSYILGEVEKELIKDMEREAEY